MPLTMAAKTVGSPIREKSCLVRFSGRLIFRVDGGNGTFDGELPRAVRTGFEESVQVHRKPEFHVPRSCVPTKDASGGPMGDSPDQEVEETKTRSAVTKSSCGTSIDTYPESFNLPMHFVLVTVVRACESLSERTVTVRTPEQIQYPGLGSDAVWHRPFATPKSWLVWTLQSG